MYYCKKVQIHECMIWLRDRNSVTNLKYKHVFQWCPAVLRDSCQNSNNEVMNIHWATGIDKPLRVFWALFLATHRTAGRDASADRQEEEEEGKSESEELPAEECSLQQPNSNQGTFVAPQANSGKCHLMMNYTVSRDSLQNYVNAKSWMKVLFVILYACIGEAVHSLKKTITEHGSSVQREDMKDPEARRFKEAKKPISTICFLVSNTASVDYRWCKSF